jgi:hypothetical protein
VFNKSICEFLSQDVKTTMDTDVELSNNAAVVALTVLRKKPPSESPVGQGLGHLLNSPKSHHDFVLVGNDGEETKAHKFMLAGLSFHKP